jgi:hypothetical protein
MVPEATRAAAEPPPPVPTSLSLLVLERGQDIEPRRPPGLGEPFVVEEIGRRLAFITDNSGNRIEFSAPR